MADKGLSSQSYGFSSSHVWMWELDYKESWAPKNWGFRTMVLEKTLESPLDCKEIQPVHPKVDQSWVFIGKIDAEAETPIPCLPDAKNWLIWKDPDAGKDWRQEEKGMTEDEMVGWHHQLDGHEFEQAPGVDDRQESLKRCSPWGRKVSDMTEWLNWTELNLPESVSLELQFLRPQIKLFVLLDTNYCSTIHKLHIPVICIYIKNITLGAFRGAGKKLEVRSSNMGDKHVCLEMAVRQ